MVSIRGSSGGGVLIWQEAYKQDRDICHVDGTQRPGTELIHIRDFPGKYDHFLTPCSALSFNEKEELPWSGHS